MSSSAPDISISAVFFATLRKDLLIAFRRRGDFVNPLIFFLMVCSLFPMGVGPEPQQLALIPAGPVGRLVMPS